MRRLNQLFLDVSPRGLFATLFFGVFDFAAACFEYVNAGHEAPILIRTHGTATRLSEGGPALGVIESPGYFAAASALRREDLLVAFSDGVTDRANRAGDMFGRDRLEDTARANRFDPARLTLYSLLGEVQGWSEGQPPEDDATLIVARVR
jgi:sigma-B regulation protein RsbU (phosphoserine phosphatase)